MEVSVLFLSGRIEDKDVINSNHAPRQFFFDAHLALKSALREALEIVAPGLLKVIILEEFVVSFIAHYPKLVSNH